MRPLRPRTPRSAATAGAAALALVALGAAATPTPAGASTNPNAQSEYQAAVKAAAGEGVHFTSSGSQGGVTIAVHGVTGATSGAQTLTVKRGSRTERVSSKVVGSTGYVKADAAALQNVIGLGSSLSRHYAGTWLSFPASNGALAELVSGLLSKQVANELQMSGPYRYGTATTVHGQPAVVVRGHIGTQSGSTVPVALYVAASGKPLPIEEVTNPDSPAGSSALRGTVTFSNWGQRTSVSAPARSVSLLKLVPNATSGATSTTGG